jgi:hypothetical protein
MLPITLLNIVAAGIWHFMSGGILRWLVFLVIVVPTCILLARALRQGGSFQPRIYRYAD